MSESTFGHYRVDAPIGEGGMGAVFRAFDTRLNRPVAIKLLRARDDATPQAIDRLLREAQAASALNHPNIVTIHDVGQTAEGDHFIVQELIDGCTLRSMLAAPLLLPAAIDIGTQIARALGAAHAAGIVHRDVKPENIMIRGDGLVKVLDFGLARQTARDTLTTHATTCVATAAGAVLGTPAYMAPEQGEGSTVGPAVDVFSLGVVLYELATGQRPFGGNTAWAILSSIATTEPVPVGRLNAALPPAFGTLVLEMLEKAPHRRPSAIDVERRLGALAHGERAEAGTGVAADAPAIARGGDTPVGREAELARLLRAYERVRLGRGLIVGISGEPGIGKSSLTEAFLGTLMTSADRPTIVRGRCSENLAGSEAYLPVLEVLEGLVRPGVDGRSFAAVVKAVAPTWYMQVAPQSAEETPAGEARTATFAASQERMKRELAALLQDVSRTQPLVVFIDDLHWADVSTIDILNYLAGRFGDMRVLVVTSYRPSDMLLSKHSFLGIRNDMQSRGVFEEIGLQFLQLADVAEYLALQFPGHSFPPDFAASIHAKTEGSPLFMADLVRYLRDTGGIKQEQGGWVVAATLPGVPRELPESVRGMIARKIEQVDENDRKLLLAASVLGNEFDSASIAEAAELNDADVEDRLDLLERVHVLVRRGVEFAFPDSTPTLKYQFVHVLYQNVLYGSLQPTRRARLSGALARSLAAHHGRDTASIAGRVALLFETARDYASSADYFFAAARRAVGLFAFREALALADRGLEGLKNLPDTSERQQRELGLQMVRGLALRTVKGWAAEELEPTFARARHLCQQLDDAPALFPVLWNIALFHMIRGDLALVREQAQKLMPQAEQSGNNAYLVAVHHLAGVTAEFTGDLVDSHRWLERARELHDPAEHHAYNAMFGMDPGMIARAMVSRPLWTLGYPDQALAAGLDAIAIGRSQRQPATLVFGLVIAQGVRLYRGEIVEAMALGAEIVALCREYEFPQEAEWAGAFQGSSMAVSGRVDEGITQLRYSIDALQGLRSGLVRTQFQSLLADALARAGRIDEGLAAVADGFAHAERTSEHGFDAELHRVRGELLRQSGDLAGAAESLRTALAVAAQQQARSFELRAATALARLLHGAGQTADARALLSPVYDWFTEGHTTADLAAARTLLAEMD